MRFKKLICIGLSIALLASAAGCGGSGAPASEAPSTEGQTAVEAAADPAGGAAGDKADKALSTESGTAAAAETASTIAAAAEEKEISPEDISVTWEDSHVYGELTLGAYDTIVTYGVKGYEDVPFIKASDYLNILFEGKEKIFLENGVMTIRVNGTDAVIDPGADTIVFDNPARLRSSGLIDNGICEKQVHPDRGEICNHITQRLPHACHSLR